LRACASVGALDERERGNCSGGVQRIGIERSLLADLLAPSGFRGGGIDLVEDVPLACDRASRQAAGEDLRQYRHVGNDSEARLRAAARPAKARDDLVEEKQDAVA